MEARRGEWAREGSFVVSALNQRDLLGYGMDTLRAMVDVGMVSDFRNIFLIHDKRFMRLWFEDAFTSRCLSPEDAAFLRAHAIPTRICCEEDAQPWLEDAFRHKDAYILKPWRLGKSEGVQAGPLTRERDWRRLWKPGPDGRRPVDGMVIQPFLEQRSFPTVWETPGFASARHSTGRVNSPPSHETAVSRSVPRQFFPDAFSTVTRASISPVFQLGIK